MRPELRDRVGGAAMMTIGAAAAWQSMDYKLGTLTNMKPGFFPAAIGVGLVLIGALIIAGSRARPEPVLALQVPEQPLPHGPQWRGWFCIAAALAAFVILGQYAGLVAATLGVTFIAAMGDRRNTPLRAGLLALGVLAVSVTVFWWGLGLQFPLFGGS
jgi:hypothetical protein